MARYTISIHMDEISGQRYPSGKITTDCVYREKIYVHKYKNKEEFIDLCKNNENLDTWLDIIAKKPYLISGYSEVCNSIKKCPDKSYVY